MKQKLTAAGSVLAAILASSCCWGPLLLAGLGAGGVGFAATLAPYRPYLIGLTFLFLGGAWYFALRRNPAAAAASPLGASLSDGSCAAQPAPEACCASNGLRRRNVLMLSGVTAFMLAMLAFPQISSAIAVSRCSVPTVRRAAGPVSTTTLAIQGMTCEACALHLRDALLKVPGVVSADVSTRTASAKVTYQRGRLSTQQLKQAVARAGFSIASALSPLAPNRKQTMGSEKADLRRVNPDRQIVFVAQGMT